MKLLLYCCEKNKIGEFIINNIEVSFVIPCLNEEKTLAKAIAFCDEAIYKLGTKCEIVVSDNGSTDESIEIAASLGARVVHAPQKGYGNALIHGIKQSVGKYIVMGDADATYDFRQAVSFIEIMRKEVDTDMVIGSRLKGRIEPGAMPFLHRYLGTPVLSFLIRMFFKLNISDCNCGMRAFTKEAFNRMSLISGGMEFASEMLIKAGVLNLNVKEVNISLYQDTRGRPPHLKTWRDGWRHLKFILTFAPKYVFYYPGLILIGLGVLVSLFVTFGPISIGGIPFDYNFMFLGTVLGVSGYQLLWLSKFERHYVAIVGYLENKLLLEFSLDKYAKLAGIWLFLAIVLGLLSLIGWQHNEYTASWVVKRTFIYSLDFILFALITITNAFMLAMMHTKIHRD